MISLHKLHSHIHYEDFYYYKKFQKFSINTLITIVCPNFRNKQNPSPRQLGIKEFTNNWYKIDLFARRELWWIWSWLLLL